MKTTMNRNLILWMTAVLMLLASVASAQTQPPKDEKGKVPKEYRQRLEELKRKNKQALKDGFDIVLDPIEAAPVAPSEYTQNTGTWAWPALQLDVVNAEVERRATRPVDVFVFDTGIEPTHPGFGTALWRDNFKHYTGEAAPGDGNGHGTHVAGTFIGTHPSGVPVGICAALVKKGLIRVASREVLSDGGFGSFAWVAPALEESNRQARDLIRQGRAVVYNFSMGGGTGQEPTVARLIKEAQQIGVAVFCAAGNSGGPGVIFPANTDGARAVGALDRNGSQLIKASFSTTGPQVYCSAPGARIYSTYKGGSYMELSGTSMATPTMAAAYCVLASVFKDASTAQLMSYLERTLTDLPPTGRDENFGFGFPAMQRLLAGNPGGGNPNPDPGPGPDPNPNPDPVNPEKPLWSAQIGMPIGDTFFQAWRKEGQSQPTMLKIKLPQITVTSNFYGERIYDQAQIEIARFYQRNTVLVVRNVDDYVSATAWSAHFLKIHLDRTLTDFFKKTVTTTVNIIIGEDNRARTCWHTNPVRPTDTIIPPAQELPKEVRMIPANFTVEQWNQMFK